MTRTRATGAGLWMVAVSISVPIAPRPVAAQAPDVATIVGDVHSALGGDARIGNVKTFIATGRTRQVRGDNLVPIEFEIQVQLPDRFARRDEFPAQDAAPATSGFNADALIQAPSPSTPPARPGGPPPPTDAQRQAQLRARVVALKQDFARLMLGMFGTSSTAYPLAFTYAGQAEAPQGKAQVLEATAADGFKMRLFIDAQTHLPLMVTWLQSPQAPRGGGPPPAIRPADGGGSSSPTAPPPAPEHRLYFADYRAVDGLQLPFRLRHAVGADTIEETTFDRFRINARVDAKRFDAAP